MARRFNYGYPVWAPVILCVFLVAVFITACGRADYIASRNTPERKVMLLGIDGATYSVLLPLIKMGRVPVFERLMQRGAYAYCKTLIPTLSPVIWNTIVTGMTPTEHGIHHFLRAEPYLDDLVPYTSRDRRVPAFWDICSAFDIRGLYMNWMQSWPTTPVSGAIIGDQIRSGLDKMAHPPDIVPSVERAIYRWQLRHGLGEQKKNAISKPSGPGKDNPLQQAVGKIAPCPPNFYFDFLEEVFIEQVERVRPSCSALYINSIDPPEHRSWRAIEPEGFRYFKPGVDYAAKIMDMYSKVDLTLSRILDAYEQSQNVIIVSDHGMESRIKSPISRGVNRINIDLILLQLGFLTTDETGQKIDWVNTVAFTSFHDRYRHSARIAVLDKNKSDNGFNSIAERLTLIHDMETGRPLFTEVTILDENELDVVFDPDFQAPLTFTDGETSFSFEEIEINRFVLPGHHFNAPPGIIILSGPDIKSGRISYEPSVFDVLPTILALLNVPLSQEFSGSYIAEALINVSAPESVTSYGSLHHDSGQAPEKMDKIDLENLKTRLRDLGYIE